MMHGQKNIKSTTTTTTTTTAASRANRRNDWSMLETGESWFDSQQW